MAVASMSAGNVIVGSEGRADADRDGFFTDVEVGEAGHQRSSVQIVDLLFEEADGQHPPIHAEPFVILDLRIKLRWV
jgi:hypothetical protein